MNYVVRFIARSIDFTSEKVILALHKSLIKNTMYNYSRKGVDKLGNIQRKVTKIIP